MQQGTLDLRAGLANLAAKEQETATVPAKRPTISLARQNLVHTMMLERYPAEVVAERFPKIDWDNMTVASFKERFAILKGIPTLASQAEQHKPCFVQREAEKKNDKAEQIASIGHQDLVDGYYTIVFPATENEPQTHLTLRLRTQKGDADFMPGKLLVSLLIGPDNESDYMRVGHVVGGSFRVWTKHRNNGKLQEALLVLCGDPRAAQAAYAEISRRCARCDRTLTHPDSQVYGPECIKKMGM
jgi:hypothetical protein